MHDVHTLTVYWGERSFHEQTSFIHNFILGTNNVAIKLPLGKSQLVNQAMASALTTMAAGFATFVVSDNSLIQLQSVLWVSSYLINESFPSLDTPYFT